MRPQRLFRLTSALLLAATVAGPAAAAAVASVAPAPHECTDHACFCRRASTGSPAAPCHGEADRHGARMTAACKHGADPAQVAAVRPGLLPAPTPGVSADGWEPLLLVPARSPAAGFRTVESPPPQPTRR